MLMVGPTAALALLFSRMQRLDLRALVSGRVMGWQRRRGVGVRRAGIPLRRLHHAGHQLRVVLVASA